MAKDWKDTQLWKAIGDSAIKATLEECMNDIEAILRSGSTMPLDFTLHDAEHSYRVAEKVADLIPESELSTLGELETAMVLLASYLHDIGMSPSRELMNRHRRFIELADPSALTSSEKTEIQKWLDGHWSGIEPPIPITEIGPSGIRKADEILAYYCRHKHNDWSESWIRENLYTLRTSLYHGWLDDLVTLCRSHHEGLNDLRSDRFDLRVVGQKGEIVNLRYLAALLRVGDVLDFDPERTPSVIMMHRDIAAASKIYWQRDHAIHFSLVKEEHSPLISVRTPNAKIHKAVLDVIEYVNAELNICATLNHEGLFQKGTAPVAQKAKYQWPWPSRCRTDVREKDSSFVYIDGGFKPDKVKILHLLSGTKLYGNPYVAIRELLQNAVDAVKEQIALERLLKDEPEDSKWNTALGEMHNIKLILESDGDDYYLTCLDDGVGMDREIIEKHLLVSGSAERADSIALERNARKNGFSVGRTGQFGIGLLSYFMLAESISIYTRRSYEASITDNSGWRFRIDGLDGFGELSPHSRGTVGSEVRLKLTREIVGGDSQAFAQRLEDYISQTMRYSPCRITFIDNVNSTKTNYSRGWIDSREKIFDRVSVFKPSGVEVGSKAPGAYIPAEEEEKIELEAAEWNKISATALENTQIFGPMEGVIEDFGGNIRTHICYVNIKGNASLGYMNINGDYLEPSLSRVDLLKLSGSVKSSWRGFYVYRYLTPFRNVITDVDCTEKGSITVDRREIEFQPGLDDIRKKFEKTALKDFLKENKSSKFSLLNCAIAQYDGVDEVFDPEYWISSWPVLSENGNIFSESMFPCVDILLPRFRELPAITGISNGHVHFNIFSHLRYDRFDVLKVSDVVGSGNLAFTNIGHSIVPTLTWESESAFRSPTNRRYASIFPSSWSDVALVFAGTRPIYNVDHSIIAAEDDLNLGEPLQKLDDIINAIKAGTNKSSCRRIIISNLTRSARFWNGFRDNFPSEFRELLQSADLPEGRIRAWHFLDQHDNNCGSTLDINGMTVTSYATINSKSGLKFADGYVAPFPAEMFKTPEPDRYRP